VGASGELDVLAGREVFPDASVVFSWHPASLEEIKGVCLVIPDTNTLVFPYTLSSRSLDDIGQAYRTLVAEDRLIVPGQVSREFAKTRTVKIAELQQQLLDQKSKPVKLQTGRYPLLGTDPDFQLALSREQEINRKIKEYQDALGEVVARVRQWSWTDPVSNLYRELFQEGVVLDPDLRLSEMERDLGERKERKLPPGYKDASKDGNALGDLLIWHTILEAGRSRHQHVVFVTNDEKADWWHRSAGTALFARYELVEEFRRVSEGKSFYILMFSQFLELFGASSEVLDEVKRQEVGFYESIRHTTNALLLTDGAILVARNGNEFGAVKALRQTIPDEALGLGERPGIDYEWWFQGDGSGSFLRQNVGHGFGRAEERGEGYAVPQIEIGPMRLEWSMCRRGAGWVYFNGFPGGPDEYELAQTNLAHIEDIDVRRLTFMRGPDPEGASGA
jgi:hypothetical protein